MIYDYIDKNTKVIVSVDRSIKEYDKKPTIEEALKYGLTEQEWEDADWQRKITGGSFTKGFGGKGHW